MASPTTADRVVTRKVVASDKIEYTGLTPLGLAVTKGNVPATRLLINYAPEYVNVQDNSGNTALHYAVATCNKTMVGLLLSTSTINREIVNNAGQTPMDACEQGFLVCHGNIIDESSA